MNTDVSVILKKVSKQAQFKVAIELASGPVLYQLQLFLNQTQRDRLMLFLGISPFISKKFEICLNFQRVKCVYDIHFVSFHSLHEKGQIPTPKSNGVSVYICAFGFKVTKGLVVVC